MAYPILKPNSSWFTPTVSTIKRATITTINIVDSYIPSEILTDSWDASVTQDGSIMCYVEGTVLTIAGNGSGKIMANEDCSYMFSGMTALTSVDCGVLDTSNTTNMEYMFGHTKAMKLTSINFGSNFNTSKVTNMLAMFRYCNVLPSIDVTNFDVSSCTTIGRMFDQCKKLTTVGDLSNWDTSKVQDMSIVFQYNHLLTNIGSVANWNTSNVTDMRYLFSNCQALPYVDVSKWNTSKVKDMEGVFQDCHIMTEIDVFNWDTSSCEDMQYMFNHCYALERLDLSNWDVSKVENMMAMFQKDTKLKPFSVKKWNVSSCKNMSFMFYEIAWTSIDFEDWDVSNVEDFDHMLAHANNLANYNVSKWNVTNKCTNLQAMFHSTKATTIDVTGWDVSNVFSFTQVFEAMTNLKEIKGLDTWNTSSGICFGQMFSGCSKLEKLNLSSFDTRKAKADGTQTSGNGGKAACTHQIFYGMSNLREIILGENFTFAGDGTASDSYHGTLPTPSATYIDGADGNWYTEDDAIYAPAVVPNLTYAVYYASPTVLDISIWERDSKKYMHLSAMRKYHNMHNEEIDIKLDILKESISEYEELTAEDIQSLFI